MLCSRCSKNEASVHLKQIVNNKLTELSLCESCAGGPGLGAQSVSPILELLAGLADRRDHPERRYARLQCAACGLKYPEFRGSGILGCPACYESFAEPMKDILKHIHGATRHAGKAPPASAETHIRRRLAEESRKLREELGHAIRAEHFEQAAKLRDRLRELEK